MNLNLFAETIRSSFNRLLGGNGSVVCNATTTTGRFYTLYIASEAVLSAVTGGGSKSATWIDTIPAGVTLTCPFGEPVTSLTVDSGLVVCY